MHTTILPVHPGLVAGTRLPAISQEDERLKPVEVLLLLGVGVTAALATAFLDFSLRIPGHAIIRAVFPMAFGLALVPRRMGGLTMGLGALGTATVLNMGGFAALGMGAVTSLTLTGPLLDAALWRARRGWRLHLGFALAGLTANMAALAVRAGAKLIGTDHAVARPLAAWLPEAVVTYAICGIMAGLISAVVWFEFSNKGLTAAVPETTPETTP